MTQRRPYGKRLFALLVAGYIVGLFVLATSPSPWLTIPAITVGVWGSIAAVELAMRRSGPDYLPPWRRP
jgi:hypothetical protein